jgi:hypothetical protein
MAHLRSDTLELYYLGRLKKATVRRTEEHLLVCEKCRERLDAVESLILSIRAASDGAAMTASA